MLIKTMHEFKVVPPVSQDANITLPKQPAVVADPGQCVSDASLVLQIWIQKLWVPMLTSALKGL